MNTEDRYTEEITNDMAKSILPEDVYSDKYHYQLVINLENIVVAGFNPEDPTDRIEYLCEGSESIKLGDLMENTGLETTYVTCGGKKADFRYYKKVGSLINIIKTLVIVVLIILVAYLYGIQKL